MAKVQKTKSPVFNLEAWKKEGESALDGIDYKIEETNTKLGSIIAKFDVDKGTCGKRLRSLKAERVEVMKALGRSTSTKVRLRSHIVKYLDGNIGDATITHIHAAITEVVPGVSVEKVAAAVKRYVTTVPGLSLVGEVVLSTSAG